MTDAEAEGVVLALRILLKGGIPEKGLVWINSACATHRFDLAPRQRNRVITVERRDPQEGN